ncbi:MAG TPA: methionine--tRNA ligase [Bryobacteraceae bacterium]|nr:methionine--tRNA ligase [Bryobacteraceae bacterium]
MKYYITTPIYYVNAAPHIGHTYTTIAADTIKRVKRMEGFEAYLTTGTDEHGQKIERAAAAAGQSEQEFTDVISSEFRNQWKTLNLDVDFFQRTTSPQHAKVVQELFQRCLDNGSVYRGSYTGQYCVFDELYVNDAKPGDPCPDCGRPTETVTEDNYFFKLSAFQDKLLQLYDENPDFILPETRRNEVLAFVKQGLTDLSISRTTIKWGIPLPVEGNHVFYVWFDALTTYKSAVEDEDLWPADLHLIGKEIVRFHAIFWPAFLMAAGYPLPKRIFAHGWLLFENDKMSKSRGNIVRATPIADVMGIDALRYFLLREVTFGKDGSFSYDALIGRYNSDLANGLGNLVSRTLTMINQYRDGFVPAKTDVDLREVIERVRQHYDRLDFSRGLEEIWSAISWLDGYIVQQQPWKLAKSEAEGAQDQLDTVLYTAAEYIRVITALVAPVLPATALKIWRMLGMAYPIEDNRLVDLAEQPLPAGQKVEPVAALFPRIEAKQAVDKMRELEREETRRQRALFGQTAPLDTATEPAQASQDEFVGMTVSAESQAPPVNVAPLEPEISIDDFVKVDLRVGLVKSAEPVKGADKLLHLKVDIGEPELRTIVAGIAKAYAPEQLIGRKVVIVANLAPRKLRGIESRGMIVAASLPDGPPVLAGFLEHIEPGARLK